MAVAALIATIIVAIAVGKSDSQYHGWIALACGIFATGVLWRLESIMRRRGWTA